MQPKSEQDRSQVQQHKAHLLQVHGEKVRIAFQNTITLLFSLFSSNFDRMHQCHFSRSIY